jgi:hypothetical protein
VRLVVLVCALAPVLAFAATAEARGWRSLGRAWGPAEADNRFVLIRRTPIGPNELLDTRTGVTTAVAPVFGCSLAGVGAGLLLWDCSRRVSAAPGATSVDAQLLDLRTRRLRHPPVLPVTVSGEPIRLDGIGKFWIEGRQHPPPSGYHSPPGQLWFNWRTGALTYPVRTLRYVHRADTLITRRVLDPDLPTGVRTMCAPLKLQGINRGFSYDFGPATYADGRLLTQELRDRLPNGAVQLQRCGRRPHVLDPCRKGCRGAMFERGLVAWANGTTISAYDVRTRRTGVWRHAVPDSERDVSLTATDSTLVRSVESKGKWQLAAIAR